MVDMPERIHASLRGPTVRNPSNGRRMMVGGWSENPARPGATEYVRADLYADLYAELEAENERLTSDRDGWMKAAIEQQPKAKRCAEALSRTGAVKVIDPRHFNILAEAMAEVKATSDGLSYQPIADIVQGCIDEIAALEPAAPEGRQDEDAFDADMCAVEASINSGARPSVHRFSLTRPSEQAVTEDWQPIDTAPHGVQVLLYTPPFACMGADAKHEMRAGCASWGEVIGGISNRSFDGHATYWRPLPNPPSSLKAAMEAGR